MKRILSFFLSLVLLLSLMSTLVFADETEVVDELTNVALNENAMAYASSHQA